MDINTNTKKYVTENGFKSFIDAKYKIVRDVNTKYNYKIFFNYEACSHLNLPLSDTLIEKRNLPDDPGGYEDLDFRPSTHIVYNSKLNLCFTTNDENIISILLSGGISDLSYNSIIEYYDNNRRNYYVSGAAVAFDINNKFILSSYDDVILCSLELETKYRKGDYYYDIWYNLLDEKITYKYLDSSCEYPMQYLSFGDIISAELEYLPNFRDILSIAKGEDTLEISSCVHITDMVGYDNKEIYINGNNINTYILDESITNASIYVDGNKSNNISIILHKDIKLINVRSMMYCNVYMNPNTDKKIMADMIYNEYIRIILNIFILNDLVYSKSYRLIIEKASDSYRNGDYQPIIDLLASKKIYEICKDIKLHLSKELYIL